MSLRQAAAALRTALPRIAAQAATETGAATANTARTLKTTAAPRGYHYVSCFFGRRRAFSPSLPLPRLLARAVAPLCLSRGPTAPQRAEGLGAPDPRVVGSWRPLDRDAERATARAATTETPTTETPMATPPRRERPTRPQHRPNGRSAPRSLADPPFDPLKLPKTTGLRARAALDGLSELARP